MISLPIHVTGVHILGSNMRGMNLPATPDREANTDKKLSGLRGDLWLQLCQICLCFCFVRFGFILFFSGQL